MISLGFRQCPCHTALGLLGSEVFVLGDGQCSFSFGPNGQAQVVPSKMSIQVVPWWQIGSRRGRGTSARTDAYSEKNYSNHSISNTL